MKTIERGDIFYINFGPAATPGIQAGKRPCIVVSNDKNNQFAPTVNVLPLTTKIHKVYPQHARLQGTCPSLALAEQIRTISKCGLKEENYIRIATIEEMEEVNRAIRIQMAL